MNRRADFVFRVRLATMAKSAQAIREQDGAKFADILNRSVDEAVGLSKQLFDVIKNERIPPKYERDYTFQKAYRYGDADKAMADRNGKGLAMMLLVNAAELSRWLIRFKSIPKGQAKALERAAKPFLSARRAPRKIATWIVKNEKNLKFLTNAYKKWPDKGEDSPDKYPVGPFTVHNTLQLDGDDLTKTNKVIEAGTKFLKSSGIPGAAKMLYGDIYVVGKLQGHNTLAWYNFRDDNVYLRPLLKANMDATASLTHEIGHRYWRKVLPKDAQRAWQRYHQGKRYEQPDVGEQIKEVMATIKPGQPMPVPIKGRQRGGPPIVLRLEDTSDPRRARVVYTMPRGKNKGEEGSIRLMAIANFLGQQAARKITFPTPYASTSPEEHFAESFGMYSMKKLTGTHKENFEKIIVNR